MLLRFGTNKVRATKIADKVGSYRKTPQIERKWCTVCGRHPLTDIHFLELVDFMRPYGSASRRSCPSWWKMKC